VWLRVSAGGGAAGGARRSAAAGPAAAKTPKTITTPQKRRQARRPVNRDMPAYCQNPVEAPNTPIDHRARPAIQANGAITGMTWRPLRL
jgi:hypothetical protein